MERDTEASVTKYEQEKVSKVLGGCNPSKVDDDSMGSVAIP